VSNFEVSCVRDYTDSGGAEDHLIVGLLVRGKSGELQELQCQCSLDASSECESPRGTRIRLDDGDSVAVRVDHSLPAGAYHFTFSFLFN
jgi:hypothetical protein